MGNEMQDRPHFPETTPGGPHLYAQPVDRIMKTYCVVESELRHISLLNTLSQLFFSMASALISTAISVGLTGITIAEDPELKTVLQFWLAPILAVLGIIGLASGLWVIGKRKSEWDYIHATSIVEARLTTAGEAYDSRAKVAQSGSTVGDKPSFHTGTGADSQ